MIPILTARANCFSFFPNFIAFSFNGHHQKLTSMGKNAYTIYTDYYPKRLDLINWFVSYTIPPLNKPQKGFGYRYTKQETNEIFNCS